MARAGPDPCLFAPAGFEQFLADIHESVRAADYDMRRFGEVLAAQRAAYGDEEHSGV